MTTITAPPMTKKSNPAKPQVNLDDYYKRKVEPHLPRMPWVLRVTDHKKRPSPVFVIKYRKPLDEDSKETRLVERGVLYGDQLLSLIHI